MSSPDVYKIRFSSKNMSLGNFLKESPVWDKAIFHTVNFNKVYWLSYVSETRIWDDKEILDEQS